MANNLSAFDADQFSTDVVEQLRQVNVMLANDLVNRQWEGDLKQGKGSTVWVRTVGKITLQPYTAGAGTLASQNLTPSKEAFQVNDAQVFQFFVDDTDAAQNDISADAVYRDEAVRAINDCVENKILAQYTAAHADNKITGASNAAITIDASNVYGYFLEAAARLDAKKVPRTGRYAIVTEKMVKSISQSPDFIRSTAMGDAMVRGAVGDGNYVGRFGGFDTYMSASDVIKTVGADYALFADKLAIAYASQIIDVEKLRSLADYGSIIRSLLLHDAFVSAEASKRMATLKVAK